MYSRNYVHKSNVLGAGLIAFVAGAALWAVFGDRVKKSVNQSSEFQDLKKQIYDKASKVSDLTQDKYDTIVDEVTSQYAKVRGISNNELRDLAGDLKWHWRRIKSAWSSDRYSSPEDMNS